MVLLGIGHCTYADAILENTVLTQRLELMLWITSTMALAAITFLILWKRKLNQPIWIKYCAAAFSLLFFVALIGMCYTSHALSEYKKYHKVENPFAK